MKFEEEYKFQVKLEAMYIADDIKETAEKNAYEQDLFLEDVIKAVRKQLGRGIDEKSN